MSDTINPTPDGILLVDKPAGMTSHDVVFRVRRLFGTKKVGHTGTLDPLATGVLVVLLGRAAKASEYVSHDEKVYVATMRPGMTTDTEDVTGTVLSIAPDGARPTLTELEAVLPQFRGDIRQIPPMYSALKVGGRKLCDLARAGQVVEREARPVSIRELRAEAAQGILPPDDLGTSTSSAATPQKGDFQLYVRCSGGTYIRTLCADIGAALGCGAVMATLRRVEAGGFPIGDCHTLDELEAMEPDERMACLRPVEQLFSDLPIICLPDFFRRLCRDGCEIYQRKLGTQYAPGVRVRLCDADGSFFALGEVMEFESGTAIKAIKLFVL